MATTTASTKTATQPLDTAFKQVEVVNEQFLAAARKASNLYVDSYEKVVDRTIELELKVATMTEQEWLKSLIEAQAEVARDLVDTHTAAARSLLK
jgi:hypothetical protein